MMTGLSTLFMALGLLLLLAGAWRRWRGAPGAAVQAKTWWIVGAVFVAVGVWLLR